MERTRFCALLCVLLVLSLLLGACSQLQTPTPEAPAAPISLWLLRDHPLAASIESLTETYNASEPYAVVVLRFFDDEAAMAQAMDSARPDLLLCGAEQAIAMHEQGRLRSLSAGAEPLPASTARFRALGDCVDLSFFPLCADVQLLAVNAAVPARTDAAILSNMERLCLAAAEQGKADSAPFFSADSFAALFAACLAQTGDDFAARREEDIRREAYRRLYNLLADAAFTGGLLWECGDLPAAVSDGRVGCAVCFSSSLVCTDDASVYCYPLPLMPGGEKLCLAEIYGFAVTSPFERSLPGAARFLRWLCAPETSAGLLLDEGYLPAADGPWPERAGSFAGAMRAVADGYGFVVPAADSGYRLHGKEFERSFRDALALLA